jgi:hypothetical protein
MPQPKTPTTPAPIGHNSVGPLDRDKLREIVSGIENIEQERAELAHIDVPMEAAMYFMRSLQSVIR